MLKFNPCFDSILLIIFDGLYQYNEVVSHPLCLIQTIEYSPFQAEHKI